MKTQKDSFKPKFKTLKQANTEEELNTTIKRLPKTYQDKPQTYRHPEERKPLKQNIKSDEEVSLKAQVTIRQPINQTSVQHKYIAPETKLLKVNEDVNIEEPKQSESQQLNKNPKRHARIKQIQEHQLKINNNDINNEKQLLPGYRGPVSDKKQNLGYVYVKQSRKQSKNKKHEVQGVIRPMAELFPENKQKDKTKTIRK